MLPKRFCTQQVHATDRPTSTHLNIADARYCGATMRWESQQTLTRFSSPLVEGARMTLPECTAVYTIARDLFRVNFGWCACVLCRLRSSRRHRNTLPGWCGRCCSDFGFTLDVALGQRTKRASQPPRRRLEMLVSPRPV